MVLVVCLNSTCGPCNVHGTFYTVIGSGITWNNPVDITRSTREIEASNKHHSIPVNVDFHMVEFAVLYNNP